MVFRLRLEMGFLLVPAYPGSPGTKAIKRLLLLEMGLGRPRYAKLKLHYHLGIHIKVCILTVRTSICPYRILH